MKKLIASALFILSSYFAHGQVTQPPGVILVSSAPSGACVAGSAGQLVTTSGTLYTCQSGTWAQVAGSGGSVTFDQIGSGTNLGHGLVCGAGCVMSATGGGFINANEINGIALSGLASGTLCNTTSTGVPSICTNLTGATINATTQFLVPNGSAGYGDNDSPTNAFVFLSNFPAVQVGGTQVQAWEPTFSIVNAGFGYTWASGAINATLCDTGIYRDSAGVIDVGNCASGNKSGTINATNATFTGLLTAPTAAVATNTTQVATTAFALANTVGATLSVGTAAWGAGALNAAITSTVASHAGHFTNIQVLTALGGTCTTPPQFNVFAGTTNIGTPVTATITTQTKGNSTNTAQTLAFAAGDTIGIYISTAGAVCTVPVFSITAQYSTP